MPPKRATKRRAEEANETPVTTNQQENEVADHLKKATTKTKKSKKPTTMKEKILDLLANEEKLVGLPTLKKILQTHYEVEDTKANVTRIKKALKELEDEENPNFGKINSSYHGGEESVAYKAYKAEIDAKEEEDADKKLHKDQIRCPFCKMWNDNSSFLGEDSIARGGRYQCIQCDKLFYSWISDGYEVGHEVEYKRSGKWY